MCSLYCFFSNTLYSVIPIVKWAKLPDCIVNSFLMKTAFRHFSIRFYFVISFRLFFLCFFMFYVLYDICLIKSSTKMKYKEHKTFLLKIDFTFKITEKFGVGWSGVEWRITRPMSFFFFCNIRFKHEIQLKSDIFNTVQIYKGELYIY